jgi:molybdopterin converting factor small subunit
LGITIREASQAKTQKKREKKYQNAATIIKPERKREEMQVKIHYISLVKSYTNKSHDEFTFPNNVVLAELLDKIAEFYGKQFTTEVYDPVKKEMKATFVAMVNGVLMDQLKGMNTPLKDGDSIILMSLMTGG